MSRRQPDPHSPVAVLLVSEMRLLSILYLLIEINYESAGSSSLVPVILFQVIWGFGVPPTEHLI